jgi:hypothetical protein
MLPLMNAKDFELFWEQPNGWQRSFVLSSGEAIYAKLDFNSEFSTLADAITEGKHWTFKRIGCFSTWVSVRWAGSKVDLATYHPNWTGSQGQIQFSSDKLYTWRISNFWGTRYSINREDGLELIAYQSGSRTWKFTNLFKQQAQVISRPEAWQIKELPILMLLGWYLVILRQEDSAAAAVVVT